jgi:hypothetical protein
MTSAKRIGYLRLSPAAGEPFAAPPTAAAKAMWRKLVADGKMETGSASAGYRRTPGGDRTVAEFDAGLPETCRVILNTLKAGEPGVAAMKGMATAVAAGLVTFVEGTSRYRLTEAGERAADPIGEEGYFTKSGNLVRVLGVSVDQESGIGYLHVERLAGESKRKRMLIPRDAFARRAGWPDDED